MSANPTYTSERKDGKLVCGLCFHTCALSEGEAGFCRARVRRGAKITCANYGQVTALALDPIEKKPLRRFRPGGKILSVGSFGCNLRCAFCQNHEISMMEAGAWAPGTFIPPQQLMRQAEMLKAEGNIGIAYTYNEPLVGYEYVYDCARAARERGLANVLVTNGTISREPLLRLLPLIDAANIDLKGFSQGFYHRVGGDLGSVKRTIELAAGRCHVEVTTLIIPGENDSEAEMDAEAGWLASVGAAAGREIPLHVTRFFPRWQLWDRAPTPLETVRRLAAVAGRQLRYVYMGNC